MEIAWKVAKLFVGLLVLGLCSGFPIGLENSAADYHTQFLTGLVGVLLTVCGVVFLVGCLCCQREKGFKEFHNSPVVASSTSSLDHGHINPIANGEFTIFTPLSPPHHNNNVFLANEQIVGRTEIDYNHADIDVHSWFDGTERDFPRTKLKYIKELGKGWFGRVVEGTAQGLNGDTDGWLPVAVRILEASATSGERAVFLHDATIYRCGKHPHILQLLGRSLESVPLLLLQELCPRGDLKKYLRDNHGTAEKLLSSDLPLLWCCQLSSALKHLHDHRLTHPDLAARNCYVVADLSLKLGDYGLAASLYPEDYYQGAPAVPVRWCAPESLTYTSTTIQPKQITFEGNVWSLGVTMWEIYACGMQPYAHLSDDDVISQVLGSANVRLAKPDFSILYTDYIFRLMQLCWSTSESRPSVSQVHLMLTDLMQVYQNTKNITHSEPLSIQDFDQRWDTFKPNSVIKTDNQDFIQENKSLADLDLSDITILNMNLNKEELSNTKPMSPSLNNLHGSLDNLTGGEMDSWLQKVAHKTGDMSYVRGLSEAIKDLDNALALENVSSSDSSHQPSPAPENLPALRSKLEFKLGPTAKTSNDSNSSNKTQNSSLTESMQRTSSESETEDENWRRKIEQGAYSEKVHQKSKSVTDLMILTHIDCSESDSETPLPSLDYRVNYRNVRYAPKQNLENASLMFGSEGNLLSVHDKFQEELRRLQEERKDSLLFVPESVSQKDDYFNCEDRLRDPLRRTESSSSDEEPRSSGGRTKAVACTYVNKDRSANVEQLNSNSNSKNASPNHRNPESLIEELSSPADIQPGSQVYNIFNVTVDSNFSPIHIRPDLKDIICFEESETKPNDDFIVETTENCVAESPKQCFQVPKLTELIQNNDGLMDYIITKYESQENLNANPEILSQTSEANQQVSSSPSKELNNNIRDAAAPVTPNTSNAKPESSKSTQLATQDFLQHEQESCEAPQIPVQFDVSQTQEEVFPSSMIHSAIFCSTPFAKRELESLTQNKTYPKFELSSEDDGENLQFSSNFADVEDEKDEEAKSEMNYSLETWDNFLGKALECPREGSGFEEFSSEPQSLLFVDGQDILDVASVECKNETVIENYKWKNDLKLETGSDLQNIVQNVNTANEKCSVLNAQTQPEAKDGDKTFTLNKTFTCKDDEENINESVKVNDITVVLDDSQLLNKTYNKENEGASSNWEPGEGWFLHPQTNTEVSGQMEVAQSGDTESYVGFSMDDEIMAAIRNELLMKLPQAQGQSSEQVRETDEWDTEGRSEVLIKYNVYTTPLSPIPEESCSENDSHHFIYNRQDSSSASENGDWPEPYEEEQQETESRSVHYVESPVQEPPHRHTPSQDSCCSNDTLFNLEELTCAVNDGDNVLDRKGCDVFEESEPANKTYSKDIEEESTLKAEGKEETEMEQLCDKVEEVQQNGSNDRVHISYSQIVEEILPLALSEARVEERIAELDGQDSAIKDTNMQKTETLTCYNNIVEEIPGGNEEQIHSSREEGLDVNNELLPNETNKVEANEEAKVVEEHGKEELGAAVADRLLKISGNEDERMVNNVEQTETVKNLNGKVEVNSIGVDGEFEANEEQAKVIEEHRNEELEAVVADSLLKISGNEDERMVNVEQTEMVKNLNGKVEVNSIGVDGVFEANEEQAKVIEEHRNEELAAVVADSLLKISGNEDERIVNNKEETETVENLNGKVKVNSIGVDGEFEANEEQANVIEEHRHEALEVVVADSLLKISGNEDERIVNNAEQTEMVKNLNGKVDVNSIEIDDFETNEVEANKETMVSEDHRNAELGAVVADSLPKISVNEDKRMVDNMEQTEMVKNVNGKVEVNSMGVDDFETNEVETNKEAMVAEDHRNAELGAVVASSLLKISDNEDERMVDNMEQTEMVKVNSIGVGDDFEPNEHEANEKAKVAEEHRNAELGAVVANSLLKISVHEDGRMVNNIEQTKMVKNQNGKFKVNFIGVDHDFDNIFNSIDDASCPKLTNEYQICYSEIVNINSDCKNIQKEVQSNAENKTETPSGILIDIQDTEFVGATNESVVNVEKIITNLDENILNPIEANVIDSDITRAMPITEKCNHLKDEIDTLENWLIFDSTLEEQCRSAKNDKIVANDLSAISATKGGINGNRTESNTIEVGTSDTFKSEVSYNEDCMGSEVSVNKIKIENGNCLNENAVCLGINNRQNINNVHKTIESVVCLNGNGSVEKSNSSNKNETDVDPNGTSIIKLEAYIDESGISMDGSEEVGENDVLPSINVVGANKNQINETSIDKSQASSLPDEGNVDVSVTELLENEANGGSARNTVTTLLGKESRLEEEICTGKEKANVLNDGCDIISKGKVEDVNISFIRNECNRENNDISEDVSINKDVDKLLIKNVQSGIVDHENPSQWINNIESVNENDGNLINVFDDILEKADSDSSDFVASQAKDIKAESFSLLVENNPNYITEFLNHERQSSISSLGSSRDDDDEFASPSNLSLQNNKNLATDNSDLSILVNEQDYVNIDDITIKLVDDPVSYVNTDGISRVACTNDGAQPDYVNVEDLEDHLYDPVANDSMDADIYDALTDIRFTGPTDIQLMSTSFSESADIDEQDWDSGSDTRSSSSGEFIWKEGEHEESVKALRAAPQDVGTAEKITPLEDIEEVTSESSDDDEDGDNPEFVPSAWDKYATPTKSALRSPEKTLEKAEVKHKKSKGVWFKKQKYHCVYEYPREPESPNVNSYELWQPVSTSLIDWEVDTSPYMPTVDGADAHPDLDKHTRSIYQLADFTSGMTALDDEFYISSTARPFETFGGLSSQFFPGQNISDQWMDLTRQASENITPDSGVEDITPAGNSDSNEFLHAAPKSQVQSLKALAGAALKQNQISDFKSNNKGSMGGLRHARNKLKLDLPPSPSAFTSTKAFTIEPPEEPVTKREVPTFTTFGKSRFLVQHVDTPTYDEDESKNVSFEALPYKPMVAIKDDDKAKVEIRGEASLLDSADEDSGIESSTLERKKITNVAD